MDKINRYFNYSLINGYKCIFNGICTREYSYLLLIRVNYVNNFSTFQLPKQKSLFTVRVINYYTTVQICITLLEKKVKVVGIVEARNFVFFENDELYLCFC